MFLFKMTVTITYLSTDPKEIDILYTNMNQTFQSFAKPIGYNIVWGESKLRVPTQTMDQAVTESDTFVIERKFLQYKNILSSVKIFSGIIDLLQTTGYVSISWKLAKDRVVVE